MSDRTELLREMIAALRDDPAAQKELAALLHPGYPATRREWVDARSLAEWLGWPVKRVRNLTRQGRIPCVREGKRILYHVPTVRKHLLKIGIPIRDEREP